VSDGGQPIRRAEWRTFRGGRASVAGICRPMMLDGWPLSPASIGCWCWPTAVSVGGEAIALRVDDVQFLRHRLSVLDNAVQLVRWIVTARRRVVFTGWCRR
jgi:hypothetical protein